VKRRPDTGAAFLILKLNIESGVVIKTGKLEEIKAAWLLAAVEFSEI
jgi:hypothetical protein